MWVSEVKRLLSGQFALLKGEQQITIVQDIIGRHF